MRCSRIRSDGALIGFALDQQVTVEKAFAGPLALRERLGSLDAADARRRRPRAGVPRETRDPSLPRLDGQARPRPGRVRRERYDGDAARVWTDAADAEQLRANLAALPGFGEMKVKSLGAVLAKRYGVSTAADLVPAHPTLGDVDSRAGAHRVPGSQAHPQGRVDKTQAAALEARCCASRARRGNSRQTSAGVEAADEPAYVLRRPVCRGMNVGAYCGCGIAR